ncbi:MAG TPA: RNA polymerase sigma factor, partial [Gemmatales bacterium]|nr:RNA polymerase sigma factor [Gemmatales bacterium]
MQDIIQETYERDSRAVFATLARLLGDLDHAEEALQEAFASAMEQWPKEGLPANPRAWLISTGRNKAIDAQRRRHRQTKAWSQRINTLVASHAVLEDQAIEDDQLRLIFTCCHPALAPEIQVALTLREVCGLRTEEIARAFLEQPSTLAQRIVRGKAKIRHAGIPFCVPGENELAERLDAVLTVIYLVFSEGYAASEGADLLRTELAEEAIRLGRKLLELLPRGEVKCLLALMLLHHSRRQARKASNGDVILLEDQDRNLWDQGAISEGLALLEQVLASGRLGAFSIQAAIAAEHARAPSASETNWNTIITWYDALYQLRPTPVIALNRAVALAMRDGPARGLEVINGLLARGGLGRYALAHAARADLLRRLKHKQEA